MKRKLSGFSFRVRLLLGLLLVNIPMFIILSAYEVVEIRNFAYQREIENVNMVGSFLTGLVSHYSNEHDTTRFADVLIIALNQPQIKELSMLDAQNTVLISTNRSLIGKKNPSPPFLKSNLLHSSQHYFSFPVHIKPMQGKPPRFIQIQYSFAKTHGDVRTALWLEIVIDILEICIIILIAWFISAVLLKPLIEMRGVAEKMAEGNFTNLIPVKSKDVIGKLAAAFNNMSERLQRLTNNLHEEIQVATLELTARNKELKEKQEELELSNKKLRELDMLKSDFVSMVSHELRTPLTSIIGFAKTLKTLQLPQDQQRKYLDIIESEGKRLSVLVEEYLDISKIESGNISLQLAKVNCAQLINDVYNSFSVSYRQKMEVRLPVELLPVTADAGMIKQVLYNIVDNAIKYANSKDVIILSAQNALDGIEIRVMDSGRGIAPDEIEKVFDKFYRGKNNGSLKGTGSGLGLAIAKGIIEAHHGRIWCESELGKGTIFNVFLPR